MHASLEAFLTLLPSVSEPCQGFSAANDASTKRVFVGVPVQVV